ncbi:efflux RND transporter periplasmic adaptor subunit [Paenibacillus mucilaginosus]|uniref:Efflux transporter, RND family, MFP subunit n=1 Tax=Paenibacillus mucilaginosus (strain KNP414) TaxID=1036673 RepID=F8FBQ3_PAEMK|nr:efflux RND transporter periplasmic adaptor subunit [Paenibacillus mucilaginosus]AEI43104.1 efflux transporter, RND family, MFP subunit [Paenibacillus mucilaginosus KNP414]MCG7212322.1 efflux RND transporter periplasmic adaptor subunit [Paenibacillus mucilaginosus]WDM24721.1 efflux RND transporter periplasmic adaptor subunit [Paenibacillus mucilaginosus]
MSVSTHHMKLMAVILSSALLGAGCGGPKTGEPANASVDAASKVVRAANVQKITWEEQAALAGEVTPFLELDLTSKVGGDVTRVLKKRGDLVTKDETILEIEKIDMNREKEKVDAALVSATEQLDKARKDLADSKKEIDLSIAKADLSLAELERDYAKLRNQYDEGLIEKNQLRSMETRLEQARLDLELLHDKKRTLETSNPLSQAEYQLRSAQLSLEEWQRSMTYYDIKSPISGVLTYMPMEEGMTLQPGLQVGKVQQQDKVKIKAQLTEAYWQAAQGQEKMSFVQPGTGEAFEGKVIYLSSTADPQTKTFELQLGTENPEGRLKPGTRVQLNLAQSAAAPSLAVPFETVVEENGASFVYIVKEEHVEKRQVETGRVKNKLQEIVSGLDGSERIVTQGQMRLKDGERVTVVEQ